MKNGDDDDDDFSKNSNDQEDIAAGEAFLFGLHLDSVQLASADDREVVTVSNEEDESLPTSAELPAAAEEKSEALRWLKELCQYQEDAAVSSPAAVATEQDFVELFDWATQQGAVLGGMTCQTDSHGGRGLFATRDLGIGEAIAMLPRSLRWGQAYACQSIWLPCGSSLLPPSTPDLTALTLLVLQLCRDHHIYAKCLPRQSQFTNALLMTKEEQEAWGEMGGPEYSDAIRRVRSIGEGCQDYIRHVLLEEEKNAYTEDDDASTNTSTATFSPRLLWAVAMVKSRSHAFGSKRGYWLTPVLDLVNHSLTPNAALVGGDQGQLLLQALEPISKGKEITIDYQVGDDSDAMLLAAYGFSLLHESPVII